MPLLLTERALVKDLANIARADTLWDDLLSSMIEQVSEQVEMYTRRNFTYQQYTETYRSYDQDAMDPDPQYIWLSAYPVDMAVQLTLQWSIYNDWDQRGITLLPEDYVITPEKGLIIVRRTSGLIMGMSPYAMPVPLFRYAPEGFRIIYTGGYPVSVKEEGTSDPMDDYGVVQVPAGLKRLVAQKVAADFANGKTVTPFDLNELESLKPYRKRDLIF